MYAFHYRSITLKILYARLSRSRSLRALIIANFISTFLVVPAFANNEVIHAYQSQCSQDLHVALKVLSPHYREQRFTIENPTALHRLTAEELKLLTPSHVAKPIDQTPLPFSVHSIDDFETVYERLQNKGMWILFNPVNLSPAQPVAAGHFQVMIRESLFERMGNDLISKKISPALFAEMKTKYPFMVAQYFDLNENSITPLEKFFHDRVWFHYEGSDSSYFAIRPLSRNHRIPHAENCLTFACPWWNEEWKNQNPLIAQVADEMGSMNLSEVPSRQIFFNPESTAYRGTFFLHQDPTAFLQSLEKDGLATDPDGQQLLLEGSVTPIAPSLPSQ
jgi:hypothetical protein